MSAIRGGAFLALGFAAVTAVGSSFPSGSISIEPPALLGVLAIIMANAVAVLRVTRGKASAEPLGSAALVLVLVGVAFALILASTPMWFDAFVPSRGIFGGLDSLDKMSKIVPSIAACSGAALLFGWGLWAASLRFAGRGRV